MGKVVGPNAVTGSQKDVLNCEICHKGKLALPFSRGTPLCNELLKIVYFDVVGLMSRWCEVYFLSQKRGVLKTFRKYKVYVERQTGRTIKSLQSDNGEEYLNKDFNALLTDCGIETRLTISHTPQQNRIAEQMNRTLLDIARCLLLQSGLLPTFWAEAVVTACYIRVLLVPWKAQHHMSSGSESPQTRSHENFWIWCLHPGQGHE